MQPRSFKLDKHGHKLWVGVTEQGVTIRLGHKMGRLLVDASLVAVHGSIVVNANAEQAFEPSRFVNGAIRIKVD